MDGLRSLENVVCVLLFCVAVIFWISPLMNAESLERPESKEQSGKQIELHPNLAEQEELQAAVDRGHQPWRLEPVDVAIAALVDIEKNLKLSDCRLAYEDKSTARVDCKVSKDYSVLLRRIVKPNGIWMAVSVTIR